MKSQVLVHRIPESATKQTFLKLLWKGKKSKQGNLNNISNSNWYQEQMKVWRTWNVNVIDRYLVSVVVMTAMLMIKIVCLCQCQPTDFTRELSNTRQFEVCSP